MKPSATKKRAFRHSSAGRVHLYVGISLDGFIAGPSHELDWLDPYQDARAGFGPFAKTIGSAIMGRSTYDVAASKGFADFGMPAYVVTTRPLPQKAKCVTAFSGDLAALVSDIREKHPRDIWLMGGGRVAVSFAEADLIDIWSIAFIPALLGAGIPMFPGSKFDARRLRLVKTRKYPSGVVELRYERA
jgi:dihydrofolate reductase